VPSWSIGYQPIPSAAGLNSLKIHVPGSRIGAGKNNRCKDRKNVCVPEIRLLPLNRPSENPPNNALKNRSVLQQEDTTLKSEI
jgi:hypothetical protein